LAALFWAAVGEAVRHFVVSFSSSLMAFETAAWETPKAAAIWVWEVPLRASSQSFSRSIFGFLKFVAPCITYK
jgi:hypothetical protein